MVHRLSRRQSQKPASPFPLLAECAKAEGTPTWLEQDGLSLQHSSSQGLLFLACSRWQNDCSPAPTTPIRRIKEKLQHKNSHTNRKQSRQYCHKHLRQTAQPSPLCWLVDLPRECGHWHCQPVAQVNQGPLLTCASWLAAWEWFLSPHSTHCITPLSFSICYPVFFLCFLVPAQLPKLANNLLSHWLSLMDIVQRCA